MGGANKKSCGSVVEPECGRSRNPPPPLNTHPPTHTQVYMHAQLHTYTQTRTHAHSSHTFTSAAINYLWNIPTGFLKGSTESNCWMWVELSMPRRWGCCESLGVHDPALLQPSSSLFCTQEILYKPIRE